MKSKPRTGTSGQPQGSVGKHNPAGGGAIGQPHGTKNKGPKPRYGATGQRLSGSDGPTKRKTYGR